MKTPNPKFTAALAVTLLSCASLYSGCRLRHEIAREGVGLRAVAELCSGRLIDPENAEVLGELFVFEDDREQAVRLLKM